MSTRTHDPTYLDVMFAYGIDPRARRVFLHGDMDQLSDDMGRNTPESVVRGLLYLDRTPGEIELWISTDGGSLSAMFGIYDVVRTRENLVKTVAFGEICSAGCLVLVAGDKRYATPNSWFMSHSESGQPDKAPTVWDQADRTRAMVRQENRWAKLMGERTKKPEPYWLDLHRGPTRELWLDARQMVRWGIVDEVLPETHLHTPKRRRRA